MTRFLLPLVLTATGAYIALSALSGAGITFSGIFADPADKIRAEAELKRVDVEMLKAQSDHIVRMALIEKATEPRTPALILFCLVILCLICGALLVVVMRYREQAKYNGFQAELQGIKQHLKQLPAPQQEAGQLFDAGDHERRIAI